MKPDYMALKKLFEDWQEGMKKGQGWNALFWCNHDQPRIVSRMGNEGKYWKESAKMLAAAIHMMRETLKKSLSSKTIMYKNTDLPLPVANQYFQNPN